MSVRFFVTASGLLIFSWLAAAYFQVVPMETYPAGGSGVTGAGGADKDSVVAVAGE